MHFVTTNYSVKHFIYLYQFFLSLRRQNKLLRKYIDFKLINNNLSGKHNLVGSYKDNFMQELDNFTSISNKLITIVTTTIKLKTRKPKTP